MSFLKVNCLCYLIIFMIFIKTAFCTCPSDVCTCKWKGGKQTVECGDKFLTDLPEKMDPGTQVLNFSGNNLQYLMSERFYKLDLVNLQKIFLPRNQLSRIHDKAFRGLSNLVELDLSENMLTAVPSETFKDYSSLMRLILCGNPIRELKSNAFKYLSFLTTLELSNCQISKINDEAFIGLDNLEWLKLDGNRISTIRGNHILPTSLHGINMQGNRWNCDCNMINLHAWLVNYNVPQQVEDPRCMYPERLSGEVIKFLKADDLACAPAITPTTLYLEMSEGRNISLLCKITAAPEVTISWWFQGHMVETESYLTPNLHLYYYIEEGIEEKRSELFIYNVNADDNGTFSCVAENSAGRIQANYTIRVTLKEEPIVEEINFSREYFIIIVCAGVAAFVIVLMCCCIFIKCRSKSKQKRKSKQSVKDTNMQLQSNQIQYLSLKKEVHAPIPILKNGNLTNKHQDLKLYVTRNAQNSSEIPSGESSQYCTSPPNRNFQDQNPDLVNDSKRAKSSLQKVDEAAIETSCIDRNSTQGSPVSCENGYHPSAKLLRAAAARKYDSITTLPRGINKEIYQHQVDVHLNPGCFLDQEAYLVGDYSLQGLPRMMPHLIPQTDNHINYYRTLPHKPKAKTAANRGVCYSMEAEFINRSLTPSFDPYNLTKDIRYSVEGYPKKQNEVTFADQQFPSPPEGYKTELTQAPTGIVNASTVCSKPQVLHWPPFLPGYHSQIISVQTQDSEQKRYPSPSLLSPISKSVSKRCGSAQTNSIDRDAIPEQQEEESLNDMDKLRQLTGPLADSPDEGYVGDGQEDAPDI